MFSFATGLSSALPAAQVALAVGAPTASCVTLLREQAASFILTLRDRFGNSLSVRRLIKLARCRTPALTDARPA
jgi:hypothetical protein